MIGPETTIEPALVALGAEEVELAAIGKGGCGCAPSDRSVVAVRDRLGTWWSFDPARGDWSRHGEAGWRPAGRPAGRLIGPVELRRRFARDDLVALTEVEDAGDDLGAAAGTGAVALAVGLTDLKAAFEGGELDSLAARRRLADLRLLDEEWRLWTLGFQTGRWYRLDGQGWQAMNDGPRGLADEADPEAMTRVIAAEAPLLDPARAELPEPVVDAWRPPAPPAPMPAPEAVQAAERRHCRNCGAVLPVGARFCAGCGQALGRARAEEAPRSRPEPTPSAAAGKVPRAARSEPAVAAHRRRRWPWLVAVLVVVLPLIVLLVAWLNDQVFVDAETMYWRGEHFRVGDAALKDPEAAVHWLERAAAADHAGAMYSLGLMYFDGDGVTRDLNRARQLFLDAAERGNREAMAALVVIYERGLGVAIDLNEAANWRRKAGL